MLDNVGHHRADAFRVAISQHPENVEGQLAVLQNAGSEGVHQIVVQVGDGVGDSAYLAFEGQPFDQIASKEVASWLRVHQDSLAHFPGEVQAIAFLLQLLNNAEALVVVPEASGMQRAKLVFANVSKGGVSEVVAERDGFGQVFVEVQRSGDGSGNLGDFKSVSEPGDVVVALGGDEHLSLVFQAPESLCVKDAVAVSLILSADGRRRLRYLAAFAGAGLGGIRRESSLSC